MGIIFSTYLQLMQLRLFLEEIIFTFSLIHYNWYQRYWFLENIRQGETEIWIWIDARISLWVGSLTIGDNSGLKINSRLWVDILELGIYSLKNRKWDMCFKEVMTKDHKLKLRFGVINILRLRLRTSKVKCDI